jgi:hypothetical protein
MNSLYEFNMKEVSQDFLEKNMCLDMAYLESQINSDKYVWHKNKIFEYIDYVCDLLINHTHEDIKKIISEKYKTINKNIFPDGERSELLNCIRIAFISYLRGGIKYLWENREGETKEFPRIIINRTIDTAGLEDYGDIITIYRGCDKSEYENNYGQSWTVDIAVAQKFADVHYANTGLINMKNRVVLSAIIPKEKVYLTFLNNDEKELVIDTKFLLNIEIMR